VRAGLRENQAKQMDVLITRTVEEFATAYERLRPAALLGCDTETSGLNPSSGRLYSIQFSDGEFNVLVPLSEGVGFGPLSGLLRDTAITKIFHNARFDLDFLAAAGERVSNVFDTMIAEKILTRGAGQSASLAETLYRYFAVDLDKAPRSKFNRNWDGIWTEELVNYALSDVVHLPRLMQEQSEWLERLGLSDEFKEQMARIAKDC
jgi:ribonuclease D